MRLVTYRPRGALPQLGAVTNRGVVNLAAASGGRLPADMRSVLERGDEALALARAAAADAGADAVPLAEVQLLAPILDPSKIVAIGLNYADHVRETRAAVPARPTVFAKYPSAIIGPGEAIRWDPAVTAKVDYEAELAVVIGRRARNVAEQDALDCVAGYTICHDVSARDLQHERGDQWIFGKSLDTFCPLGPYLVTRDEVPDPHALRVRCTVNGELRQDASTAEMIFRVPYLIAYLSRGFTLLPGDVITTGTPAGVGTARKPPVYLRGGDVVAIEIDGLGALSNPCVEERGP